MTIVVVCAALFSLGLYGVLTRRDIVAVLASVEVMLGAANLQLVVFAASSKAAVAGQAVALLVLVVAAAEAAVGLGLLVATVRRSGRGRIEELAEVKG